MRRLDVLFQIQDSVGQDDDTNQNIEEYLRSQRGEGGVEGGGGWKGGGVGKGWAKKTMKRRFS